MGVGIKLLIIICLYQTKYVLSGSCPEPEVLYPCTCSEDYDRITCIKFNEYDFNDTNALQQIFSSLSDSINCEEKTFTELLLANTKVIELGENTFSDIKFKSIQIYENNLTRIHSNIFGLSFTVVEEIYINSLTLKNNQQNYSIFDAFSSATNLRKLTLDLGLNSFTSIPDNAFKPINGIQTNLQQIIINGIISSVGQNAFKQLPNLKNVKILSQIDYVSENILNFDNSSNGIIEIDLSYNKLLGSSFEVDSLSNNNRQINLNLAKNDIRFLSNSVFKQFFDANQLNKLTLTGNILVCSDCKTYWIIENEELYFNRINDAVCQDGKSVWNYTWNCLDNPDPNSSKLIHYSLINVVFIIIISIIY